jgi:hypothetical protein
MVGVPGADRLLESVLGARHIPLACQQHPEADLSQRRLDWIAALLHERRG